jgi:hypothetical protein
MIGLRALVFLSLMPLTLQVCAQEPKNIRCGLGLQYSIPEWIFNYNLPRHHEKNVGAGFHLNPIYFYEVTRAISINLEYTYVTESPRTDNIRVYNVYSVVPTLYQYIGRYKIKPFTGLGLGYYMVQYYAVAQGVGARVLIGANFFKVFEISIELNRLLYNVKVDPARMGKFDNYYLALKGSFSIGFGH